MVINAWGERYWIHRRKALTGSASVLRLIRRFLDGVILFAAILFTLHHFGVNLTAAMAGIGVGGIAVALAAQKTLENVIAGVSLIADQAVRAGDTLKVGDIVGTVEEVGLRSTRIRTVDRSVISLPNGQLATMSLETLSARDKFWFHPVLGLRYSTTAPQLRSILTALHGLLDEHPSVESSSVRVRLIRFAASSLDIEIFSYIFAPDWNEFLMVQEELLLAIMEIVNNAGAEMAFPSQTMYLAADSSDPFASLTQKSGKGLQATALRA
jgi:MscS family membrane protein